MTPTTRWPAASAWSWLGWRSKSCSPPAIALATSRTRSATEEAIFSGDVLFEGSVGRVDLPGGDWPTLLSSIETLMDTYSPETTVYPGHMAVTTLGRERATNPFLRELT